MDVETGEPVIPRNRGKLLFPQGDRVVAQYVKQGIVLDRRERELDDLSDKKRHHTATATPLGLQMRDTRHGHVVGKFQSAIPRLVPIEPTRSKPAGAIFPSIRIDALDPPQKASVAGEESAVMV